MKKKMKKNELKIALIGEYNYSSLANLFHIAGQNITFLLMEEIPERKVKKSLHNLLDFCSASAKMLSEVSENRNEKKLTISEVRHETEKSNNPENSNNNASEIIALENKQIDAKN